jgi:hypothetical protein
MTEMLVAFATTLVCGAIAIPTINAAVDRVRDEALMQGAWIPEIVTTCADTAVARRGLTPHEVIVYGPDPALHDELEACVEPWLGLSSDIDALGGIWAGDPR